MNSFVTIKYKSILIMALAYLEIPILLFFLNWLSIPVAIISITMLLIATAFFYKTQQERLSFTIRLNIKYIILAVITFLFFVWIADVGRMSVSNYDSPWRDAIFNDLMTYSWPVKYPATNNYLVYYFVMWLVPALAGKIFGITGGYIALFIWIYVGVLLTFLMLHFYIDSKNMSISYIILWFIIFYCGIKIIGMTVSEIINLHPYQYDLFHRNAAYLNELFNGHAFHWFYRFNFDEISNIFNQTTAVWLSTLLFLLNKEKIENYAFVGIILLPYAPLPFCGLFLILVCMGIYLFTKEWRNIIPQIKKVFSIQNVFSCIPILLVFGVFYGSNGNVDDAGIALLPLNLFGLKEILSLILFYVVEFGVYSWIVYKSERKNILYYLVIASLLISPLIEFGYAGSRDYCMNAPIPALFILMTMLVKYVDENVIGKTCTIKSIILVVSVMLAALTPMGHMLSKIDTMVENKKFVVEYSWVDTLADKNLAINDSSGYQNFLVKIDEDSVADLLLKNKSNYSAELDADKFADYSKRIGNDILEGRYYIKPDEKSAYYLRVDENGIYFSEEPEVLKAVIINKSSMIKSESSGYVVDVPSGVVDENGTVSSYTENQCEAQRFLIKQNAAGYNIFYGDYLLVHNGNGIYLSKDYLAEDIESIWYFENVPD